MRISDRQTTRNFLSYVEKARVPPMPTRMSGSRPAKDLSAYRMMFPRATKALRVSVDQSKAEEHYSNVCAVSEQLTTTEDALTSINDILVKVHTKVLAAVNGTSGESGKKTLANEITSLRNDLLQYANTTYNDAFVLGGTSSKTAPFSTDDSGNLLYNGIDVNSIAHDTDGYYYMGRVNKDKYPDGRRHIRRLSDLESP